MNPIISISIVWWEAISRGSKALFEALQALDDFLTMLNAIGDVLCVVFHIAGAILQILELFAGFF